VKRASYQDAVDWIALYDNVGNGDSLDEVEDYVSTRLVAHIFGVDAVRVARDVMRKRKTGVRKGHVTIKWPEPDDPIYTCGAWVIGGAFIKK
jgi:hypothetical protein